VRILAGILLLIVGVIFPMAMLFRMNSMLSRKPAPRPSRVGMLLTLNGVLPVALVTTGLAMLSARMVGSPTLRVVIIATWLTSVALVIILLIDRGAGRGKRGDDAG
jgi:hypothetical protein